MVRTVSPPAVGTMSLKGYCSQLPKNSQGRWGTIKSRHQNNQSNMDPIVHPRNYEISYLIHLGKKTVPRPSLTMLVMSGNESRLGRGHVLLPGTSLVLPVNIFLQGHHFKRGWPGTVPGGQQGQNYTIWGGTRVWLPGCAKSFSFGTTEQVCFIY